jgi:hypothetical protein
LKNDFQDSSEPVLRQHPELFHFRGIHDRLDHRHQNFDHQFRWHVFANHAGSLALNEKFSEVALDERTATALDGLEDVRCFLAHVAHERRLNLIQFLARSGKQLMQSRRKVTRMRVRNSFQPRFNIGKFVGKDGLEKIEFTWKMSVKSLLADAKLLGQIVHRHAPEAVTKKMGASGIDNSLSDGLSLGWGPGSLASGRFHLGNYFSISSFLSKRKYQQRVFPLRLPVANR